MKNLSYTKLRLCYIITISVTNAYVLSSRHKNWFAKFAQTNDRDFHNSICQFFPKITILDSTLQEQEKLTKPSIISSDAWIWSK